MGLNSVMLGWPNQFSGEGDQKYQRANYIFTTCWTPDETDYIQLQTTHTRRLLYSTSRHLDLVDDTDENNGAYWEKPLFYYPNKEYEDEPIDYDDEFATSPMNPFCIRPLIEPEEAKVSPHSSTPNKNDANDFDLEFQRFEEFMRCRPMLRSFKNTSTVVPVRKQVPKIERAFKKATFSFALPVSIFERTRRLRTLPTVPLGLPKIPLHQIELQLEPDNDASEKTEPVESYSPPKDADCNASDSKDEGSTDLPSPAEICTAPSKLSMTYAELVRTSLAKDIPVIPSSICEPTTASSATDAIESIPKLEPSPSPPPQPNRKPAIRPKIQPLMEVELSGFQDVIDCPILQSYKDVVVSGLKLPKNRALQSWKDVVVSGLTSPEKGAKEGKDERFQERQPENKVTQPEMISREEFPSLKNEISSDLANPIDPQMFANATYAKAFETKIMRDQYEAAERTRLGLELSKQEEESHFILTTDDFPSLTEDGVSPSDVPSPSKENLPTVLYSLKVSNGAESNTIEESPREIECPLQLVERPPTSRRTSLPQPVKRPSVTRLRPPGTIERAPGTTESQLSQTRTILRATRTSKRIIQGQTKGNRSSTSVNTSVPVPNPQPSIQDPYELVELNRLKAIGKRMTKACVWEVPKHHDNGESKNSNQENQ